MTTQTTLKSQIRRATTETEIQPLIREFFANPKNGSLHSGIVPHWYTFEFHSQEAFEGFIGAWDLSIYGKFTDEPQTLRTVLRLHITLPI